MRLHGNTILVTGGSRGIGRALAVALHQMDNRVVIAGRRLDALRAVAEANPGIEYLHLDQSDTEALPAFAEDVVRRHPDVNVLVNNAGIMATEVLSEANVDTIRTVVSSNVLGPMLLTALLIPSLGTQRDGAIVNVTSALAYVPLGAAPTYSATKAAMHSYTESLRVQLRNTGIQVIEIAPPRVKTDMDGPGDEASAPTAGAFVDDVLSRLARRPGADEVVVDAARAMRFAERDGRYAEMFATVNPTDWSTHGEEFA